MNNIKTKSTCHFEMSETIENRACEFIKDKSHSFILTLFVSLILAISTMTIAQNTAPEVTNVRFEQRTDGTHMVDIYYDVADAEQSSVSISVKASNNSGSTWDFTITSLTGDFGENISTGTNIQIIWDFASDHANYYSDQIQIKVIADDGVVDTTGSEFTLTSIAIGNGELLDAYKCEAKVDGKENSIPLSWSNVPDGTNSLAIIMKHYPNPTDLENPSSYLLLWNIDPDVTEIPYGMADDGPWYMGSNKDGVAISYTSPCSPSAGSHEYTITLYALSETPSVLPNSSSIDVDYDVLINAISTVTVIDEASLTFNDVN